MQAVIPAAGEGTRLRQCTTGQPKALVDVAGKPILTHCLE
ncbi:2-C-methyl-D-erythritol 4-phosphate cytidylyltransferase [Halovenus aranensis]